MHEQEEKAKAKDLHPKLLGGMFFFFALGATGGITSLLTSDKPIFERYVIHIYKYIFIIVVLLNYWMIVFLDNVLRNFIHLCSPHAVTGFIGLALLTIQTILPALFEVIQDRYRPVTCTSNL